MLLAGMLLLLCGAVVASSPDMGVRGSVRVREATCPEHCTCSSQFRIVNCEHRHLTSIPPGIPATATTLLLGYNSLTSLESGAFSGLPNLTTLSLKNNFLVGIKPRAFEGLSHLKYLTLTGNKLVGFQNQSWAGLAALQKLYLSQNQLTNIPDLEGCAQLTELGLENNKIVDVMIPGSFSSMQKFSRLTLNTNPIRELTAKGFDGLRNTPITKLSLGVLNELSRVENGTFRGLTNLKSLVLSYNPQLSLSSLQNILDSLGSSPLESLDISASIQTQKPLPVSLFKGLQNVPLRKLFIKRHKVTGIYNGTFEYLPKVNYLDFSNGNLIWIEDGAMTPLRSLQILLMNSNSLVSVPRGLPAALTLADFSENKIQQIEAQNFILNSGLENLTLAQCGILTISEDAFLGLENLRHLNLSHNRLGNNNIGVRTFQHTTRLRSLDLSNNQMMSIATEKNLFMYARALQVLDMSHNSLRNFSQNLFAPLSRLQHLKLAGNTLSTMIARDTAGVVFRNLSQLLTLDLSHSGIAALPSDVFHGLASLHLLNLSGNVLQSWPGRVFRTVPHLAYLDLSKNHIAVVNQSAVSILDSFGENVSLDLGGNPFDCYCDLVWFRNWMDVTNVTLVHVGSYMCAAPSNMIDTPVLQFNPQDIWSKCLCRWWYIGGGAVVFLVISIPIIILLYKKRFTIQLKLYRLRKGRKRKGYAPLRERRCDFLGVIDYFEEDEEWVNDLVAKLEDGGVAKDLLFYRDQNCHGGQSTMDFTDSLTEVSTTRSVKTIIVLSCNYLRDSLSKFVLTNMLLDEMVKNEPDDTRALSDVVLVLLENVAGEEMEIRDMMPRALQGVAEKESQCYVWKADDADAQALCTERLLDMLRDGMGLITPTVEGSGGDEESARA